MSRSGRWRRRRRSEWSRTARTDHWRHASVTGGLAPVEATAASDLSDGIVVRTQLLGRVLGLRVLRVDGTVLVSPARPVSRTGQPPGAQLAEAARLLDELS